MTPHAVRLHGARWPKLLARSPLHSLAASFVQGALQRLAIAQRTIQYRCFILIEFPGNAVPATIAAVDS
jgi:hypothetical protein